MSLVPSWAVIRWQVLERDGHKCVFCDRTDKLHIHHKVPRKQGGTNDLANLITVCQNHHRSVENGTYSDGFGTRVVRANNNSASLRTTMPEKAVKDLGLKDGDTIVWRTMIVDSKLKVVVEKE